MCAHCQSVAVDIVQCSGRAKVMGWLVSRHPTRPDDNPRIVVRLELEEGVALVSNLQGVALADIREGLPVEVFFEEVDGKVLPQFRPTGVTA